MSKARRDFDFFIKAFAENAFRLRKRQGEENVGFKVKMEEPEEGGEKLYKATFTLEVLDTE